MISFLSTHIWLFSVINIFPMMHALESLITIRTQRRKRFLLYVNCWLLSNIPILISDMINLPTVMASFFISVLYTCEGSIWKKITISSLYTNTFFSFNALRDNFFKPYFFRACMIMSSSLTEPEFSRNVSYLQLSSVFYLPCC